MDSRSGYRASVLIALFLGIIASSFAGDLSEIGYSQECIDSIDNDGDQFAIDGGIDSGDLSCFEYPFSDGNGETDTPLNERYTSNRDYPSYFHYHRDYGGFYVVCEAYGNGWYDQLPEQIAEANIWLDSQGLPRFGCPP